MTAQDTHENLNPFRELWDLGFRRLVPVIPPAAPISEHSTIATRIRAGDDSRGKAPGVRGQDGLWRGIQFVAMEAMEQDLDVWNAWGASAGVKTGDGLIAVDIDTTNTEAAQKIYELAAKTLGPAAVRFGQKPKCLMLYEAPKDITYKQVQFSTATEDKALIEVLAEGRQFVARGVHPKTGKGYVWPHGIPRREALTRVTAEQVDAFLTGAAAILPGARVASSGGRDAPDQKDLLAPSWDDLKRTVESIPNVSAVFPSRDSYVQVAYAIKAAAPDGHEHDARELYLEWCDRWLDAPDGKENDLDVAYGDWKRAQPPFRVGFQWLQEHAFGAFFQPQERTTADDMFEAVQHANPTVRKGLQLLTDEDIQHRPDMKWLIARHIPEDGFGILYGDPGTGKSFLALDMALHVATRKQDWHGDSITGGNGGGVLYIAGEGAGDFKARLAAWKQTHGQTEPIPADRFRVVIEPLNFLHADDVQRLTAAVKDAGLNHLSLIIVDTVSRAIPGADENAQKDMTIFIQACDHLRAQTGAFVLGIHHAGKSGDLRGSTVFPGGADAIFRFERKKGQMVGRLECMKMKAGPDDARNAYKLDKVSLWPTEQGIQTSLVPARVDDAEVEEATCPPEMQERVLASLQRAWDSGNPWSMAPQAKVRYAPRIVATEFDIPAHMAIQWIDLWLNGPEKIIELAVYNARNNSRGLRKIPPVSDILS